MGDSTSVAMTSIPLTGRLDEGSPPIIGIYGVPGAGKSFLLERLEEELADHEQFAFFEGSEVMSTLIPGGLEAFKQLPDSAKLFWRENAIQRIQKHCVNSRRTGVVTGHFMFWDENDAQQDDEETAPEPVMTTADRAVFTHILYLDVDPKLLAQRRNDDTDGRQRASMSVHHLRRWVKHEKTELARICLDEGIMFWSSGPISASRLPTEMSVLVRDIAVRTEAYNLRMAKDLLDQSLGPRCDKLERILVFDGDKTLTEVDTGEMFSRVVSKRGEDALKPIFKKMGYSFSAFQQIKLLYESYDPVHFDNCTTTVADVVMLHPEFKDLMGKALASEHVGVVLITCGSAAIWRKVCARFFPDSCKIPVIGCGRLGQDSVVVTPEVKAELCKYLQDIYRCEVYAFGDSPIDLEMLVQADKAFVAVCSEQARSESMEKNLKDKLWCSSLSKKPFRPKQVLLPPTVTPRLDKIALPQVDITSTAFLDMVLRKRAHSARPLVLHATFKSAAKLLMTPTRDPAVSGPALRQAHKRVGEYLATEFLADLIGLHAHPMQHVTGGPKTVGYRLLGEHATLIVALMRGGDPMARGVSEVFPRAVFLHAKTPEDVGLEILAGIDTVLLVDSVVNNGNTAVEFVDRVHRLRPQARIFVVTGVVQDKAIASTGLLAQACPHLDGLVALRLSETKFTGKGSTDTGNRLFNTTQLP